MMNLFTSEVFQLVFATLLLCYAVEKSEELSFTISRTPSNPTIVVLGVNDTQVELEWQFSHEPNEYFVQFWRQKPGEILKQLTLSRNGNAFEPGDTNEYVANLPAKLTLKKVQRNEEYTYAILLLNSLAYEEARDIVTIKVVAAILSCMLVMELKDVGSYRCTASNGYGDDATSVSIASIECNDCEIKTVAITLQSKTWKSALSNQKPMEWTTAHDVLLCRENLVEEFYKFKKGSNDRGRIWTKISENLKSVTAVKFKANQRALDSLLEDISEREKLAQSTSESCNRRRGETDRKKAEETRFQAVERVGETKRRANEDCERKAKRQRRSGADVNEFLREKSEEELKIREEELKIREEELALKAIEVENEKEKQAHMFKTEEAMITNMAKQQDKMQTLQRAFLQQQQQQT
ncbi:hypothetical protein AWC38_SpisGene22906 [Stylophora pistillata]|uniref:Fibronectin type-III domain-containing protein n=1 Tax=Stylophora pistillata TaxID=50429 RepID=A0A2B4R5Y2_STYPI|nr:hypothetical protein AWC38_SpisGene22906 [Stylophora pistillata]